MAAADEEERALSEGKERTRRDREMDRRRLRTLRRAVLWLILIVCIGVICSRLGDLQMSLREPRQIRHGPYTTDATADECLRHLWHISRLLQQGREPDPRLTCPACSAPYKIVVTEGNISVSCPDPASHGFKDLRVAKTAPCPEVVR